MNSIFLGALVALPLLLSVFPTEVFFDSGEIAESSGRVMVHTSDFRADVYFFLHFFAASLLKLPWKVVSPPVKLQVLVSLKALVAYLTNKPVCCH